MANDVTVNPHPIQRNNKDVAMELIEIYLKRGNYSAQDTTADGLVELYKKFYQAAREA